MVEPDQLAPLDYCEKGFLVCYVLSKKLLVLYSLYEIVCHFFSNIWILLVRSLVTILVGPQEPLLANDKLVWLENVARHDTRRRSSRNVLRWRKKKRRNKQKNVVDE